MSIVSIWRAAANRTYVKVQCVCLIVIICAVRLAEGLYSMRYYNHFNAWPHSYMIPFELLEGFVVTVVPVIVFSAIVPVMLIKRIRMQWPIWMDYILAEMALILILATYLVISERISSLSKAFYEFGPFLAVALPIGGLGVLSCQRILKKYMKEIAQPSASCDASRA